MAKTDVYVLVKNCTYDSNKALTFTVTAELASLINTALDAVTNLTFGYTLIKTSRDDDTASA